LEEKSAIYRKGDKEELAQYEEDYKFTEGYKRSTYNEYVWHYKNGNRKM
jgi:hypothetical protein